jgi:membrane fusion protein (multidrug efflux system)
MIARALIQTPRIAAACRPFCGRRAALAAVLAVALTAGACAKQQQKGGFSMPPMPVEIAEVTQGRVADRFEAVGTIDASEAITVVAEIDGTIVGLPFQEGGRVERGGLLAQLDDVQLRAEVDRSEALLAQRQVTYDRTKTIVAQGAGAAQDLDDAAAALKVAQADLDLARARLSKTRIVAPFDGILGARHVSIGAFVRSGTAITDLAQIRTLRVNFSAPERLLSKLKRGALVTVTTTAFPGVELQGRIDVVEPVLDASTRSARVMARAENPGEVLRPGMSANVAAVLSERASALTIPSESVFVQGDQSFVFAVKPDSTVMRVPLTLGTRQPDTVEVVRGLQPGMRVVRAGHQKLFEGAHVIPVTSQPAGGAPSGAGGAAAKDSTVAADGKGQPHSGEAAR